MGKRKANTVSKSVENVKKQRLEEDKILASSGFKDFSLADTENIGEDWDNEEQDYENIPRRLKTKNVSVVEGLPIKTSEGKIQRTMIEKEDEDQEDDADDEEENEKVNETQKQDGEEDEKSDEEVEEVYSYDDELTEEEKIIQLQEDIAEMVEKLIEQPEEHLPFLTKLRKMSQSKNPKTSRFSLLALVTTFKSIIPGYRIRPLTEGEKKEKVSKDIAKMRMFEQGLLANYKSYINILITNSKEFSKNSALGRVSITAGCELITHLSHFNFVDELLSIVVRFICRFKGALPKHLEEEEDQERFKNVELFHKCINVLKSLLEEDGTYGKLSFSVCRLISKSLKQKRFQVNKAVIELYLSLDILSDYDPQNVNDDEPSIKLKKKDRVHLSKKERKARKERKEIEEEMRKAELQVSKEERDRNQSEILKILLSNYLQILRTRNDHLMATVLEGLAKYGFMANLELIGDFLTILKELIVDIISMPNLNDHRIKQVLFCIITSFTLMGNGNNKVIKMDMSKFIDVLYNILLEVSMDNEINKSIKLLIRTLDNIFIRTKSSTRVRNLAFTKKIYMLLLNTSEKPTLALLGFLSRLMDKSPEIKNLFNVNDRVENGIFVIEADHPNRSNAEAATIWENCLLVNHYCPNIANASKKVLKQSRSK